MSSHLLYLCIFSGAVGVVLGAILRRNAREALVLGIWIAVGMILAAIGIGWAMYLIHP